MEFRNRKLKARKPGVWRGWAANIPDEIFLAPMDPEDLDAADGLNNDEWVTTLPKKRPNSQKLKGGC